VSGFAILVKSHAADRDYALRLLASLARHNADDVPVHVVVPDTDVASFAGHGAEVIPESAFAPHLVTESSGGFSAGYLNQEIVKLAFWEVVPVSAYLCVDSDAEFLRDFHRTDFLADDSTPFTFGSVDAQLATEPQYHREHWVHREPRLTAIAAELGLDAPPPFRTAHGHAVFSGAGLASFRDRFLRPRGWAYRDAVMTVPLEPSWYTLWLQHARPIPVIWREPVLKTLHNAGEHVDLILAGIDAESLSEGYLGVVVNSNYSRGAGVLSYADPPERALGAYLPARVLIRAAAESLRRQATRR
jgi:hypothetical protein